ncbi:hypothetical protein QTP70_000072 [Hemibagrus guttatus]|uniref:Uncharacterized protein n=1 Tax=Hemibagrus guttatus TaxID=175788 RepID=A0AAE0RB17_9TELE|nr:hypothetical protein QTP70_000072 [Hemibagrus guttatus]
MVPMAVVVNPDLDRSGWYCGANRTDGGRGNPIDAADAMHRAEQEQPPSKKTALEDLLGATFAKTAAAQSKSRIEVEIDMYKKDTSIPITSCPLK